MKTLSYRLTIPKSCVTAIVMFSFLILCTKSASSQTANIISEPDFSGDNYSQDVAGQWIKWKLTTGSWFDRNGLYVFDRWTSLGIAGELSFDYIAREGTTSGTTTIKNIQTSGYGMLNEGTHVVSVSCEETTQLSYPFPYEFTNGYIKAHTYIVHVVFN